MFGDIFHAAYGFVQLWKIRTMGAVLVAISIPIFTSQLEKAREATDEANIRSIYAQLSADVLTENTTTDTTKDKTSCPTAVTYIVTKDTTSGQVTGTATYKMTQKTAGLTSSDSITVGGVAISSGDFGTGTCTITITDKGTAPTITFS